MVILIDFDNLPQILRNRGLDAVLDKVLNSLGAARLLPYKRIRVRLYGGWFEGKNLTRNAQTLSANTRLYPKAFTISDQNQAVLTQASFNVAVELAQSLEIDRSTLIENTYRGGGEVEGLRCMPPPYYRCVNTAECPLVVVHDFVQSGECPERGCSLSTTQLLRKAGQKLVDTMMTADLIHFANSSTTDICVVSSDDDLWPGIVMALKLGCSVTQLRTSTSPSAARYSKGAGPNYAEVLLR